MSIWCSGPSLRACNPGVGKWPSSHQLSPPRTGHPTSRSCHMLYLCPQGCPLQMLSKGWPVWPEPCLHRGAWSSISGQLCGSLASTSFLWSWHLPAKARVPESQGPVAQGHAGQWSLSLAGRVGGGRAGTTCLAREVLLYLHHKGAGAGRRGSVCFPPPTATTTSASQKWGPKCPAALLRAHSQAWVIVP